MKIQSLEKMSTAVRQRTTTNQISKPASYLDTPYGNAPSSSSSTSNGQNSPTKHGANNNNNSKQQLLANLISRKNAIYYVPILVFFYIVGPTAVRIPGVLYVWASKGFVTEHLLGAGVRDLVGSMVNDPHQMMVRDLDPPTPLAAYRDAILEEYLAYRKTHELPIISNLDPEEQGPLDTKGVWKTLFLKAMNRYGFWFNLVVNRKTL